MTFYKDGSAGGTAGFNSALNSSAILIGGGGYAPESFPGLIDEIAIFNRALSASEVAAFYAASSAGMCQFHFLLRVATMRPVKNKIQVGSVNVSASICGK